MGSRLSQNGNSLLPTLSNIELNWNQCSYFLPFLRLDLFFELLSATPLIVKWHSAYEKEYAWPESSWSLKSVGHLNENTKFSIWRFVVLAKRGGGLQVSAVPSAPKVFLFCLGTALRKSISNRTSSGSPIQLPQQLLIQKWAFIRGVANGQLLSLLRPLLKRGWAGKFIPEEEGPRVLWRVRYRSDQGIA